MWYDPAAYETIGHLLVRVRQERGISQLRLAERLCACAGTSTVTRHEVSRWEREERIPSGYWLGWLALALELPRDQLDRAAAVARSRRAGAGVLATWPEPDPDGWLRAAS